MTKKLKLGFHVSKTEKNLLESLKSAQDKMSKFRDVESYFQVFVAGPRSFGVHKYSDEELSGIYSFIHKEDIHIIAHGTYLDRPFTGEHASIKSIHDQHAILKKMCGNRGLGPVIHMSKMSREHGYNKVSEVSEIIFETDASRDISSVQDLLNELRDVPSGHKVIIDTAHIFESGIDISDVKILGDLLKRLPEKVIGFHLNDSKTPLSSGHDMHAPLGHGHIFRKSPKALKLLMSFCRKNGLFAIIETPIEDVNKSLNELRKLNIIKDTN